MNPSIVPIELSRAQFENSAAAQSSDGTHITFAKGGGRLKLDGIKATAGAYFVMDLTNDLAISAGITWVFYAADGRQIAFKMGLLPQLRTRIALPFNALDGSILFPPRTPGKLKTVTQGRPLPIGDVDSFILYAGDTRSEMKLTIHDAFLSDTEPDYPLPDRKMVDSLGQKLCTDWNGKTPSESALRTYLTDEYDRTAKLPETLETSERSRYGGWKRKRFQSNGYFSLHNDGRRYWLADPDGYAFFSMGLDCVTIDGDCNLRGIKKLCTELPPEGSVGWHGSDFFSFHKANLYKGFGGEQDAWYTHWSRMTAARMNEWGFNTIACWSDLHHAKTVTQPYTYIFGGRPLTKRCLFRDFPDVFSSEYADVCNDWAKQIESYADDRWLLGYFMGNEPEWAFVNDLNLAALVLESDRVPATREKLIAFLSDRYHTIDALNETWETAFTSFETIAKPDEPNDIVNTDLWNFTAEMIREYMRVPAEAIRRYDQHHLNLGIRYAWLSSEVLASGSEYVDIFSFNCYQMDPTDSLNAFYAKVKKPLIIGEFHFGALDAGLDATGLRGVTSQHERGVAYRRYMQSAAAHPMCLGAHYFTLNDQAYLGRFDGENYQIGVVDVCQRPYAEFVAGIIAAHSEVYAIADGIKSADAPKAAEIPAIAF